MVAEPVEPWRCAGLVAWGEGRHGDPKSIVSQLARSSSDNWFGSASYSDRNSGIATNCFTWNVSSALVSAWNISVFVSRETSLAGSFHVKHLASPRNPLLHSGGGHALARV